MAVTLPYELTTTEIFIGQHMDDMLTMTQAEGGATFAAGTGFIIVSADSHVKFRIAYADSRNKAHCMKYRCISHTYIIRSSPVSCVCDV